MENITLNDVAKVLAFIVGILGSIAYLKNALTKSVDKTLQPINKKIDNLELSSIKTDLVNFMSEAENGRVSSEQVQNAYQLYDRYEELGGNGFIRSKWERLKKEGKI